MQRLKIITPDPLVEALLSLLAEQLPEPKETTLLLDAAWMERMEEFQLILDFRIMIMR